MKSFLKNIKNPVELLLAISIILSIIKIVIDLIFTGQTNWHHIFQFFIKSLIGDTISFTIIEIIYRISVSKRK